MIDSTHPKTNSSDSNDGCDCCGCLKSDLVSRKRGCKLYQCQDCGLIFVNPLPTPKYLAEFYKRASGYFITANSDLSKTSNSSALQLHEMLLTNGVKGKRLLDVGCSTGSLIYHMHRLGWQVAGIDINADAVEIASRNHLDVAVGELEDASFHEGSFNVVHMGDLIEHVRSPRRTLLEAHRILKKGGLAFIKTPNATGGFAAASLLMAKAFRVPWLHSEAPYHLYEFTPEALARLIRGTGFESPSLSYSGRKSFMYAVGATGFFDELKATMKTTGRYRYNWQFLINTPKLAIVSCMLFPFYLWGKAYDRLHHTGSKITLVARRS